MGAPYTEEEDKILIEMNKAGCDLDEVAQVLRGRTMSALKARGYILGLKWSKKTDIDMDAYKEFIKGKI
jgi:hypothetical protein